MAATDQKVRVVPGIPLSALDAIKDPNVRDVLQALVDAHHVRNGDSGTGDKRFVTADEVGLGKGRTALGGNYGNVQGAGSGPGSGIRPSEVGRIITELQAMIIESPLFKELGSKIDLLTVPGGVFTRLGQSEIAIVNEITQRKTDDEAEIKLRAALGVRVGTTEAGLLTEENFRVNSDNALASVINTIWAVVGNNTGIVQEGTTITANNAGAVATNWNQTQAAIRGPDGQLISSAAVKTTAEAAVSTTGEINAKYTVRVNVNGVAGGFGIIGSANNSEPEFAFGVRANTFWIAGPNDTNSMEAPPAKIPFIVTTTARTVNGKYSPPGVYIQDAFIENGVIGYAQIGVAAVETLTIKGNAVTVPSPAFSNTLSAGVVPGVWTTMLDNWVDFGDAAPTIALLMGSVNFLATTSGSVGASLNCRFLQDGIPGDMTVGISLQSGYSGSATIADRFTPTAGVHHYELQILQVGGDTIYQVGARNCTVFGAKR
jgi:hypothetical protein